MIRHLAPSHYLLLMSGTLILLMGVSVLVGPTPATASDAWDALFAYSEASDPQFVLRQIRLPRVLLAAIIGASLATSGAIMQGVTRNDLAGPTIMGLSSGGTFCLLAGLLVLPDFGFTQAIWLSFLGAGLGYMTVCGVAFLSRGGMTPIRLALAGAVVSVLLGAITHGLTIYFMLHDEMLYWTIGGIANVSWPQVYMALIPAAPGMVAALLLSPSITLLSLGEEVAGGLGQRTKLIRGGATFSVLLLTAGAVAVAGPVGFVGVMTPHVARYLVGFDYRRIIPLAALLGSILTVVADIASRSLIPGQEIPLGLFTSMIGATFFVALARKQGSHRGGER
ncbi:iron ABC transporter permease [Blastopirellula sp. JC732]|uniref:Iron ABC transporter permease n=1 Tax=Blastopirellula sediminis TaxID=2894196 RepID=A0A9X1MQG8_9BACT|nr:iron ABC transporter permease [Blastopirellula sediminis]MCC9606192.1 iron ABC transporter permease [Blastopirellula sediminis]MCC9630510.1 iron ABC transporter permease [Blastopirellula sediminis]